ncbi:MAG: serine hydrolase [Bacteroidota bacterium]|nr:serine hydrolase [Bacteroidota bacterium]
MLKILLIILFLGLCNILSSQKNNVWVEEQLRSMSVDEKIGQLFIIRAYGRNDSLHINEVKNLISNYHIGGICFFQGSAVKQLELTHEYQQLSKYPLIISMDAEWGPAMRLKNDVFFFPKQLCLGAIVDNSLIYKMGRSVAKQLKRIGVNMNFAPVMDINNNPRNPVINDRSFGSDRLNVTAKSYAYMKGLQDGGILACGKHFPGHGDTETDSHFELPIINHNKQRLDSIELFPFRVLKDFDLASIMVGHLHIPNLDSTENLPATLSAPIITGIVRDQFQYDGLIITDALEMKGISNNFIPGELELLAFKAGNDILLLSQNVPLAIEKLQQALINKEITLSELDAKVRRILLAKYKAGLNDLVLPGVENLDKEVNAYTDKAIKETLYRNAITLVWDRGFHVPIRKVGGKLISISFGNKEINTFQHRISDYMEANHFTESTYQADVASIQNQILQADHLVISLHRLNYNVNNNYGVSIETIQKINKLAENKHVTLVVFGCPYIIPFFKNVTSVILAYEDNPSVQDIAAQLLFGVDPFKGRLPINLDSLILNKHGINRPSLMRLGYAIPEEVGLSSDSLNFIDTLAEELIQMHAAPGCQILVAKAGKIIYSKAFGYFTYDSLSPVTDNTLYDLASVTKIAATASAIMLLDDQGKFSVNKKVADFFNEFSNSNKSALNFKDILLHQGQLLSWIPFYKETLISPDTLNQINSLFYKNIKETNFSIQVADSLFLRSDYIDTIIQRIVNSKRLEEKKYLYSDIAYYLIPSLIEKITGQKFQDFLYTRLYQPLYIPKLVFNPLQHGFKKTQIAPTEIDTYYRHQVVQAYVHDMGAAMMGGISGHAGLFGNAKSLAVLMQCFLNNGNYGGIEYFRSGTIRGYTDRNEELNRRALAFDVKELGSALPPYVSAKASDRTYGHQGFTGTCVWIDPVHDLVFVFLSNRTYPYSNINKLFKNRYRTRIQDVIYTSILPE